VYVHDVADALYHVGDDDLSGTVFNIGTGIPTTINDVIQMVSDVSGFTFDIEFVESPAPEVPVSALDATLAREYLGWRPTVDLEEGIQRTWKWFKGVYDSE